MASLACLTPKYSDSLRIPTGFWSVHFTRFRETKSSRGLIIVSQDLDIGPAIEDLLLIWVATDAKDWVDQVGFVPL